VGVLLARADLKGVDGFHEKCFGTIAMNSHADDFTPVVNAIRFSEEPARTTGDEIV